jgi:hypothetical protein
VYFILVQRASGLGIPVGNSRGILHQQCKMPLPRRGDLYSQARNSLWSSFAYSCATHNGRQLQLSHSAMLGLAKVCVQIYYTKVCFSRISLTEQFIQMRVTFLFYLTILWQLCRFQCVK